MKQGGARSFQVSALDAGNSSRRPRSKRCFKLAEGPSYLLVGGCRGLWKFFFLLKLSVPASSFFILAGKEYKLYDVLAGCIP